MRIIELTIEKFDEFASNHPLRNYAQSSAYAKFMGEQGYHYDYIGYEDNGTLLAASLILYKKIGGLQKYAYAPKGFLIDYYNLEILNSFTKEIIKLYKSKGVVFLKINPEIIVSELDQNKSFAGSYNQNVKIIDDLKSLNYKRRRELGPFELIEPRINPYVNLKNYSYEMLQENTIKKIQNANNKGLAYEHATSKEMNIFYNFIKNKDTLGINYYRNMLNIFSKTRMADLILIKVNYKDFLVKARESYEIELENNNNYNQLIQEDANEKNLNIKMDSDKLLLQLKNNIVEATEGLKKTQSEYIAGAIVIKYMNRISIISSGFDSRFSNLYPNYYLYNKLFEIYKDDYDYIDLNGLSSDFSESSKYYEENQFKLEFNPNIYEFIGEFDIILNDFAFRKLQSKSLITKEFIKVK